MKTDELQIHDFNLFLDGGNYIDSTRLYFAYFKKIPTVKFLGRLNSQKARKLIEKDFTSRINIQHSRQHYDRETKSIKYVDVFYLLHSGILINLNHNSISFLHDPCQDKEATDLLFQFKKFTVNIKMTEEICVVIKTLRGLDTAAIKIKKPKLDLSKHYNCDLIEFHGKIVKSLSKKDSSGLILLHGQPGTGKSTYIRYLIHSIRKKVIFISPHLASDLDAPHMVNLLLENRNSVFVIEDAETLLTTRDSGRNSSISMLLNLTDGLLGEGLGIQVIATFNTALCNIDQALLRKGRLIASYDFKPISIDQSKSLLKELGIENFSVCQPMTLADIYNTKESDSQINTNSRPMIGFLANSN